MGFLAAVLQWPSCFGAFGRFEGFEGLSSGWDPKTMSQINGLVKGQRWSSRRRRKSSQCSEISKVSRTRGEGEILLVRGTSSVRATLTLSSQ